MGYQDFKASLGLEAIDFQISSGLKKKLTDVFQMGIDFRDNLDYSHVGESEAEKKEYRVREVFNYFRNTIAPKFMQVVKDETGLIVQRVHCIGGPEYGITGYFAVDLSMNDERAAAESLDRMTGTGNYPYAKDKEAVDDFAKMCEAWDQKSGRITKSVWGKDKKISVDMFFDVNCAYCSRDFAPEAFAADFTAAELAAIMCHETGHANSVIEHAGDMYVTRRRLDKWISGFRQEKDTSRAADIIKMLLPWVQKQAKVKTDCAAANNFIKKAYGALDEVGKRMLKIYDTERGSENFFYTLGNLVFNLFWMWVLIWVQVILWVSEVMWVIILLYELGRYGFTDKTAQGTKGTDIGANRTNIFLLERWADEYVVRHGLGAELASGLNKLNRVFENVIGDVSSARLRNSTLFNCLCKVFNFFMDKFCVMSYFEPTGYEDQYARAKRIEQDTFAFFKNPNIPGPIADEWINSVKQIQADMKRAKTFSDTKMGKAIFHLIRTLFSPVSWAQALTDAKLSEDLFNMLNELDDLQNNPLYYQAYRFQSKL